MEHTSREYRSQNPQIDYRDPLCRLGYLYRHAAANATAFERGLNNSNLLANFSDAGKQDLNVCAVGGGPGTELLGLAKHLIDKKDYLLRKIVLISLCWTSFLLGLKLGKTLKML